MTRSRLGALALLAALAALVVVASVAAARALEALAAARLGDNPVTSAPVVPPALRLPAPDRDAAIRRMAGLVRRAAARRNILVERLAPAPADAPGAATLGLAASGEEADLVRMVAEIEAGAPALRLGSWRLARDGAAGTVRLEAMAVAAWEPRR